MKKDFVCLYLRIASRLNLNDLNEEGNIHKRPSYIYIYIYIVYNYIQCI